MLLGSTLATLVAMIAAVNTVADEPPWKTWAAAGALVLGVGGILAAAIVLGRLLAA